MKTDAQLHKDICDELRWEPSINDRELQVKVANGEVTLTGHVLSYVEKCDAERITRSVSGLKALTVEIAIRQIELTRRADEDIARAIEKVLGWTSCQPNQKIKVTVDNGWVTLSGEVDWPYKIWATAQAIRYISGVTGVCNEISVKKAPDIEHIKIDNKTKINRYGMQNVYHTSVVMNGCLMTLSVGAHSFYQKVDARKMA